jgi:hypothetical protein
MKYLLIALVLVSNVLFAKTVLIKDRKNKDIIKISSQRMLCNDVDVIVCDYAIITIKEKDKKKVNIINENDRVSIYTVIDSISHLLCNNSHGCRYEAPYERTVNMIKEFKGAAVLQTPFYFVADTIRLPYLLGKTIVQSLKNKMVKGRKIIKNLNPKKIHKKIKTVRFSAKFFRKLRYALENEL